MKKKHPTENWNSWDATKEEKRRLSELYDELIQLGVSNEKIQTMFNYGYTAGSRDETYSNSLYDE
jgi:hypothetical protein